MTVKAEFMGLKVEEAVPTILDDAHNAVKCFRLSLFISYVDSRSSKAIIRIQKIFLVNINYY